jgi:hypothetical protein
MTRYAMLCFALLLAAPAVAQDEAQPAPAPEASPAVPPKLETLLENCDAHKFETVVESTVDGKPHRSKVKMCGKEGQSDSDWIRTLQDAIAKVEANQDMPESTREQIVSAVKAEIARLQGQAASEPEQQQSEQPALPPGRSATAAPEPLSNDYSVLPPLPSASPPPPSVLPPASATAAASVPSNAAAAPPAAPRPAIANPRLSFACISPEYPGGGPCVTLTRDTILTVKASAAVADTLSLRFVRQGSARAEVALGAMRKGQTLRFALPQPVCSGVVTSEVEIDVVGGGEVLDREGPLLLRC